MPDAFVGEIRLFAGTVVPTGWALCNGQLLPISSNTALFSLLGTMYGGDGKSTFALPDLRGMAALQTGQGAGLSDYAQGQIGGAAAVTLSQSQLPSHTHTVPSNNSSGDTNDPVGNTWAMAHTGKTSYTLYSANTSNPSAMSPQAVSATGGGLPHNNLPPYLVLNYMIALQGIFPTR